MIRNLRLRNYMFSKNKKCFTNANCHPQVNWGVTRAKDKGKRLLKKIGLETDTLCPRESGQYPYYKVNTL